MAEEEAVEQEKATAAAAEKDKEEEVRERRDLTHLRPGQLKGVFNYCE